MLDPSNVPDVDSDESLARFVFSKSHFSRENGRVKAAAFMPAPNGELSVNRRRGCTEDEIWEVGLEIALARDVTLYARGDVLAATYASQRLGVSAAPIQGNPNHVNIIGWPMDDKARLKLAQREFQKSILKSQAGATRQALTKELIEGFQIAAPPVAEQKRIAEILAQQMAAVERARIAAELQLETINAMPTALLREAFQGRV